MAPRSAPISAMMSTEVKTREKRRCAALPGRRSRSTISAATGYHVNSAVMMYVTVAEGIVVDDVVYFVLGFLHHRRLLPTATGAMRAAVEEVGDGVVLTAFCLSSGFLLMLLGDITNAQLMGGLTAAAVAVALVGVLCVLPALARLLLCPRGEDVHAAEG